MSTPSASHPYQQSTLDRAIAEAAQRGPAPADPIGQRRLRWLSASQRQLLRGEILGGEEALVGAFMMAYYRRLQLEPEVLSLVGAGLSRRAQPEQPGLTAELEPTVSLSRILGGGTLRAREQPLAARRAARRVDEPSSEG